MFEEMRLAALVAKNASNDPTVLPAAQAVAMATRLGARALHMEHLTGSLEPGKRADLILVDIARIHNAPRFRREPEGIYAQLVYAAHANDVTDVMVNGQWVHARRAVDHPRREGPARPGRGVRPPHRPVPDRARALGALQIDRHRRRAWRGRASRCRRRPAWPIRPPCWRHCAGLTSKSCTSDTTASTTPTSPGPTPTRASCAIARTNSWTPTAR